MNEIPMVLCAFGVIFVVILVFGLLSSSARRKMLQAWCDANGLQFDSSRGDDPGDEYSLCDVMQEGHGRYGENWCRGTLGGREICAFDYHYTTGSGKSESSHSLSILAVRSSVPLAPLTLRPETLMDKLGAMLGGGDINFESAEFSRKFHVASPDRKWAYDVLHQRTMEFLLECDCGYHIQFDGDFAVLWDGRDWEPPEIENAFAVAAGILDRLPEYVLRQQSAQG